MSKGGITDVNLIDVRDARPIYEQITESYKLLIIKGVLVPDEKMPSVRQLAMELSTNPNTVQRAFQELERQGYLYTIRGKGSFVSGHAGLREQRKSELAEKLSQLLLEGMSAGFTSAELIGAAEEVLKQKDPAADRKSAASPKEV